jgi:hypothetical protein
MASSAVHSPDFGGGVVPPAVAPMIKKRPVLQQDYPAQDHRQLSAALGVDHEEKQDNGVIPTASTLSHSVLHSTTEMITS